MKKTIFVVVTGSDSEPILSSFSEEQIIEELHDWCGYPQSSDLISDEKIVYDGEYVGNLERVVTYKTIFDGVEHIDTFKIWQVEVS